MRPEKAGAGSVDGSPSVAVAQAARVDEASEAHSGGVRDSRQFARRSRNACAPVTWAPNKNCTAAGAERSAQELGS
jgi:hypothetical protein